MKLIAREIESSLPPLYSQESVRDPIAVVKLLVDAFLGLGVRQNARPVFKGVLDS